MNTAKEIEILPSLSLSPIPGLLLTYRLIECGGFFYVDVIAADGDGERRLRSGAFEARDTAEAFFRLTVHHTVTPYTLDAIFDEWHSSL